VRKRKTGTKMRMRTGKKTSGARSRAPNKTLSSSHDVEFVARFFEAQFNLAFF